MRRPCQEVKRFIESGAERLPEALQAHLQQCVRCQRTWRLEQAYQRALHTARSESMPACDLPWSRVQAQLAAHAVARRAPAWQRYAYAGSLAVALLVASLAWLSRAPLTPNATNSEPNAAVSMPPPSRVEEPRTLPSRKEVAGRLPAPKHSPTSQPKPRVVARARISPTATPTETALSRPTTTAQPAPEMTPHARFTSPVQHEPLAPGNGQPAPSAVGDRLAFRSGLEPESFTIASLPLSQFELYNSSQVEYLPVRYGAPSSQSYNEGNQNDAIICSF
ncbi:MAG: hypothetical protein N2554_00750 [Fimbriimonadales bacterium]|nr:hypothetical protein [Fimbriimonadales bacterium]